MINRDKMDPLLKFTEEDCIQPSELLFKELDKVLHKGFLTAKPEIIKACSKVISELAECDDGIDILMEYGEGKILDILIQNFHDLKDQKHILAMEDLLEMLHVLVENSVQAQEVCINITNTLLCLVMVTDVWTFSVQLEASKLLNLILENCDDIPDCVLKSSEYRTFLDSFGNCLQSAGDYELQATIMEAVFRVLPVDNKPALAGSWFPQANIRNFFLAIRNEEFETDGRRFLNALNSEDSNKQTVFSFPAMVVSLGRYQLHQPRDSKVTDFWVDFNMRSSSISTFVNDDNSNEDNLEWEIVCIKKDEIRDFRVNVNEEKTILILKLMEPAYLLAPFCPEANECYVKIVFARPHHSYLTKALEKLFGHVKYVELPISSPSVSSTPARFGGKVSAAISPLAVHNTSLQLGSSQDRERKISDKTVSSSSQLENMESKQISSRNTQNKNHQANENASFDNAPISDGVNTKGPIKNDSKNKEQISDVSAPETEEKRKNQDRQSQNSTSIVSPNKNSNGKESSDCKESQINKEGKLENNDYGDVNMKNEQAAKDKPDANIHFEIENKKNKERKEEKEFGVSNDSKPRKKGKKLLRTQNVFQDSPDEFYQPPDPIKPVPSKRQQRKKTAADDIKCNGKLKKVEDVASLAAYDFEETVQPPVNDNNETVPEKPTITKTRRGRSKKKQPANEEKENLTETTGIAEKEKNSPRRSRRNANKKVDYKETSTSDADELVKDDTKTEPDLYSESNFKEEDKKNEKKKKSDKKSVSFISPLTETMLYSNEDSGSPRQPEETTGMHTNLDDTSEMFLTPEGGDPDVIVFEEKLERLKKGKSDTSSSSSFNGDLTSTPNDEKIKPKTSIKVFERNIQLGWGKKKSSSQESIEAYEFVEDYKENDKSSPAKATKKRGKSAQNPKETPWSVQKRKKEKVKKKYEMKKVRPLKCTEFESEEEETETKKVPKKKLRTKLDTNADGKGISPRGQQFSAQEYNPESVEGLTSTTAPTKRSRGREKQERYSESDNDKGNVTNERYKTKDQKFTSNVNKNRAVEEGEMEEQEPEEEVSIADPIEAEEWSANHSPSSIRANKNISAAKRFYGATRTTSSSSTATNSFKEHQQSNTKMLSSKKIKQVVTTQTPPSFTTNLKYNNTVDSDESDHISSVDASQEHRFFNETPVDTLGSHPRNHWVKQLNEKLDNIEAAVGLKKQGKRRLWKSPVVVMKEDNISSPEDGPVTKQRRRRRCTKSSNQSTPLTPVTTNNAVQDISRESTVKIPKSVSSTPLYEETNDVNNFAKFCQAMLEQASSKSATQGEVTAQINKLDTKKRTLHTFSPPSTRSSPCSPDPKRKKITEEKVSVEHVLSTERSVVGGADLDINTSNDMDYNEILKNACDNKKDEESSQSTLSDHEERDTTEVVSCYKYTNNPVDDNVEIEGNDIQAMLQTFGGNVYKSIKNKNLCIENFVNNVMRMTKKKMNNLWQTQVKARISQDALFQKQYTEDFEDWLDYYKQREKNRDKLFEKLRETMRLQSDEDVKRLSLLKQSHLKYFEERKKLINKEQNEQVDLQTQLHNDIKQLKKQMLHQAKAAEFANVRRSLQAMLNKV